MYNKKNARYYHAMLLPGMIFLVIFSIIPMFGIVMAFQNFVPAKGIFGSKFVGLAQFQRLFMLPDFRQILENTLIIALSKSSLEHCWQLCLQCC